MIQEHRHPGFRGDIRQIGTRSRGGARSAARILRPLQAFLLTPLLLVLPAAAQVPIGADFCTSGPSARYGEWAQRGVELALEQHNLTAPTAKQLKLILEDNQASAANAATIFEKFRTQDAVPVVMTYSSPIAMAVAPLANRNNIVQMDLSAFTPAYSTPDDYTFRTSVLAEQLAAEIVFRVEAKLRLSRIAMLSIENEKGESGRKIFRSHYTGDVVVDEVFKPGETDFRPLLMKLRAAKISDVFICSQLKETGMLLAQARQLKVPLRIFTDLYSVEGPDFLEAAGPAADNIEYVAPILGTGQIATRFTRSYRQRFGEDATVIAAQAFDGATAIARAVQACKAPTPECIKTELGNVRFDGASGAVAFDQMGDVPAKPLKWRRVRSGRFEDLE